MFYDSPFSSLPTKWGIDHESFDVQSFVKFLSDAGHVGLVVEQPGLLIHNFIQILHLYVVVLASL